MLMFNCLVFHYTEGKSTNAIPNLKDNLINIVAIPNIFSIIDMNNATVSTSN